jgi:alpha-N-arabinofuranosidase
LVNASNKTSVNTIALQGVKKLAKEATAFVMQSDDLYAVNSFAEPTKVSPKQSTINIKGKEIALTAAPYSFTVLRIKML